MAMSGSITGSSIVLTTNSTVSYTTYCDWQVIHQDTENNTSRVRVDMYVNCVFALPGYQQTISSTLTAGGISKSASTTFTTTGLSKVASLTIYVYHNDSGTGGFNVSSSCSVNGSSYHTTGGFSTRWVEVEAIKREALLLTAPNFTDEENPTITYSNPLGESATQLSAAISLDGTNPDIDYRDISKTGTEYTFELTEQERAILRAATDGGNTRTVLFYVRTIIGEDYYFSYKEATFTIINGMPEIDSSVIDVNTTTVALTGDEKTLVKYFSNAKAYMNMIAYKEAYFTAYYIENGGKRIDSSYSHTFNAVENNTFNFYVADNRNNAVSQAYNAPMVDYIKLTCNYNTTKLPATGEMIVKCSGNYFNNTFGATANTLTVEYRYKEQGGEWGGWYAMTATNSGNTYAAEAEITGLDYRKTYIFQCRAIDKLMSVSSAETTIKSIPLFHWSENDFTFEVPVKINENINNAAALNIGEAALTSAGNALTVEADTINLNGNVFVNGAEYGGGTNTDIASGTWQPTLTTAAAISSYSVRQGWYQRIGNVVVVGWQLKATANEGYLSTSLAISGLPFAPAYAAFGGGVAHNIYISGGFNFEGWAAGTNGEITPRIQPTNTTTAGNLQIASTAYYPTSGSVLTLAGTICYTTNDV